MRWYEGDKRPDEVIVRFDPSLSMTVDLALGSGLVTSTTTGSIALSEGGTSFATDLWDQGDALVEEKRFLATLPRKMSQRTLRELTEWK